MDDKAIGIVDQGNNNSIRNQYLSEKNNYLYNLTLTENGRKSAFQLFEFYSQQFKSQKILIWECGVIQSVNSYHNFEEKKENLPQKDEDKLSFELNKHKEIEEIVFEEDFEKIINLFTFLKNILVHPNEIYTQSDAEPLTKEKLEQIILKMDKKTENIRIEIYFWTFCELPQGFINENCFFIKKFPKLKSLQKNDPHFFDFFQKYKIIELEYENFQYGVLDLEKNNLKKNVMGIIWNLENIKINYKLKIIKKRLIIRINKENESIYKIYFLFFVRYYKNKSEKSSSQTYCFKVEFEFNEYIVEKSENNDKLDYYFLLKKQFPFFSYCLIDRKYYRSYLDENTFKRCPNFFFRKETLDELEQSYMRSNGTFIIRFNNKQCEDENYIKLCNFLKDRSFSFQYYSLNNSFVTIIPFIKIHLELEINKMTLEKFIAIRKKEIEPSIKYKLLVLNSQSKINLLYWQDEDLENLTKCKINYLEEVLEYLINSNSELKLNVDYILQEYSNYKERINLKRNKNDLNSSKITIKLNKILITPSCVLYQKNDEIFPIRNLENYSDYYEKFLLIKFVDEDLSNIANNNLINWTVNNDYISKEIFVLDKKYDFLGFSYKLAKKQTFLAVENTKKINSQRIQNNILGNLGKNTTDNNDEKPLHILNIPYFSLRANYCLDQGLRLYELIDFGNDINSSIIEKLKKNDDLIKLEIEDSKESYEEYGKISSNLMGKIAKCFNTDQLSVIQVNFFGHEIMLIKDTSLDNDTIRVNKILYEKTHNESFYKSKINNKISYKPIGESKFVSEFLDEKKEIHISEDNVQEESKNLINQLEKNINLIENNKTNIYIDENIKLKPEYLIIHSISNLKQATIDYFQMTLLSKIIDYENFFLNKIQDFPNKIIKSIENKNLLKEYQFEKNKSNLDFMYNFEKNKIKRFNIYDFFQNIEKENIIFQNDIFLKSITDLFFQNLQKKLLKTGRYVFYNDFYSLFAIKDPYDVLNQGEVFIKISFDSKNIKIIENDVLIMRDHEINKDNLISKKAIKIDKLTEFTNVIIYSSKDIEHFKMSKNPMKKENKWLVLCDKNFKFKKNAFSYFSQKQKIINPIESLLKFPKKDFSYDVIKKFFIHLISNQNSKYLKFKYEAEEYLTSQFLLNNISGEKSKITSKYFGSIYLPYTCKNLYAGKSLKNRRLYILPDYLQENFLKQRSTLYTDNLQGILYRELKKQNPIKKINDDNCFYFEQYFYDHKLIYPFLRIEQDYDKILQVLDHYYQSVIVILYRLGAYKESELYLGLLEDKSKFKSLNFTENFYDLSQIYLFNLKEEIIDLYNKLFTIDILDLLDEEKPADDLIRIASSTYLITYYFAGCQKEELSTQIKKYLNNWKNKNYQSYTFLGLPYLIFSDLFIKLKK